MAAKNVSSDARKNLQAWLRSLRAPGLSQGDMVKIYSDWAEKANYDTVRLVFVLHLSHLMRLWLF